MRLHPSAPTDAGWRWPLKVFARNVVLLIGFMLRIDRMLAARRAGKLVILCYHGIRSDSEDLERPFRNRHVPLRIFEAQLRWLKRYAFEFITLTEAVARWSNGRPLPERSACLTFDDGYENIISNAYPVMQRMGARGCLYVVSDLPNSGQFQWTDLVEMILLARMGRSAVVDMFGQLSLATERDVLRAIRMVTRAYRMMPDQERVERLSRLTEELGTLEPKPAWRRELSIASWEALSSLDPDVLEVGSHSATHPNLDRVAPQGLEREIVNSRRTISAHIGREVRHFCYPAGVHNDTVRKTVKDAGYLTGVATVAGVNDGHADRFALRRYMTYSDSVLLKGKVTGLYATLFRVRE